MRIQIPVHTLEFDEGGKTIWVHSPIGATVLRIQSKGGVTADRNCTNVCAHADIQIDQPVNFCLPPLNDAPQVDSPELLIIMHLLQVHEDRDVETARILAHQMILSKVTALNEGDM